MRPAGFRISLQKWLRVGGLVVQELVADLDDGGDDDAHPGGNVRGGGQVGDDAVEQSGDEDDLHDAVVDFGAETDLGWVWIHWWSGMYSR